MRYEYQPGLMAFDVHILISIHLQEFADNTTVHQIVRDTRKHFHFSITKGAREGREGEREGRREGGERGRDVFTSLSALFPNNKLRGDITLC